MNEFSPRKPRHPYGGGTIERYGDQFRARGPRDANDIRPVLGTGSKDECENILRAIARLKSQAGLTQGSEMTARAYMPHFLDQRELEGVRDIKNERSRSKNILAFHWADWPLGNVERKDIKEGLAELAKRKARDLRSPDPKKRREYAKKKTYLRKPRLVGPQTIKHVLNLTRQMFAGAIEDKHCTQNPCDGVKPPKVPKAAFDFLRLEDQRQWEQCEAIAEVTRLLVMFAYGSGLRQYDQWVMGIDDLRLDQEHPEMWVLVHKQGPRNLPVRKRIDLFGPALYAARRMLQLLPTYCPKNPKRLLWPLPSGAARSKQHSYGWNELQKVAGLPRRITWHELRDTCASSLLMGWWGRKWSLAEIAAHLCQSTTDVTERYAHMEPSHLAEAAAATIGHKLATIQGGDHHKNPINSGTSVVESYKASEAVPIINNSHSLTENSGQFVANARSLLIALATGAPEAGRLAAELASDLLAGGAVGGACETRRRLS